MTQNDLDKLRKYIYITLSHSHPAHLDIYLLDMLVFCSLNLMEEEINEEELNKIAWEYVDGQDIPCRYEETAREAYKAGYRKAKEE